MLHAFPSWGHSALGDMWYETRVSAVDARGSRGTHSEERAQVLIGCSVDGPGLIHLHNGYTRCAYRALLCLAARCQGKKQQKEQQQRRP